MHRRLAPTANAFRRRMFMLYLDLDEVAGAPGGSITWPARRLPVMRWRRADHPGDPARPLASWVRDLVAERTGHRPVGPVRLLTHPRHAGIVFNPISVYYCLAAEGGSAEWAVLEVTSTPWQERTHYVLDLRQPGRVHRGRFAKAMHVSPFLPMDLDYEWRLTEPGATVAVAVDVLDGDHVVLETVLGMRRVTLSRAALGRLVLSHPPMPLTVLGGIYWQALRLWRKRVPYHRRPQQRSQEREAA